MLRSPLSRDTVVQTDNYAVPAGYAIGAVLVALIVCLFYHRKLKRRVQTVHLNELHQRIDERHRCYRNESLLRHHHHYHHHRQSQQLQQPPPPPPPQQQQQQQQQQRQQQQQQRYQESSNDSRYQLESSTSPVSESDVEEASSLNSV